MLEVLFTLIYLSFATLIFFLIIAFITGAPFVPSTKKVAAVMIDFSEIKKNQHVYDLGSGDGRLLLLAAQKGAHVHGYEINPYLVIFTKLRFLLSPYRKNLTMHWGNFWKAKLNDADIVYIYLLPWRMDALAKLLLSQLKPTALIVSNSFIFPNWKIYKQDKNRHVYVFRMADKNS